MAGDARDAEAREFATAYLRFLEWVQSLGVPAGDRNEVATLVQQALGAEGRPSRWSPASWPPSSTSTCRPR